MAAGRVVQQVSVIRFNDFRRQWAATCSAATAAFETVAAGGWYILGEEVRAFEAGLADVWQVPNCIAVASGLDALEISLRILGCGPGDRVLTTPVSAFATTLAILKVGGIPVFVDTDRYGLIDLDLCEQALAGDPRIRYFVPVHLYGSALDVKRLQEIRGRYGCKLVEDCAQSILAGHSGTATGTAGDFAATSFYPTKNLGAMGDGGAILTSDPGHVPLARAYRDYGQTSKYVHELVGYNSRLDELHAAILRRAFLPELIRWTARRREIAARYLSSLQHPLIRPLGQPSGSESCWHLFAVAVPPGRKPEFVQHLASSEIATAEHYPVAIPDQPAMRGVPFEVVGELANARSLCRSQVSLPIHPFLTDDEVETVIEACNSWESHAIADRSHL